MFTFLKRLFWEKQRTFGACRSSNWGKTRNLFLKSHPKCMICGTSKDLEVHHFLPFNEFPELEENFKNLRTLCHHCHWLFGHLTNYKKYNPQLDVDIQIWRDKIKA